MICWERVNELRDEVGAEDYLEVVDIFLEEVEEVMVRLRNSPNPADLEADLHFLRGGALNLGFEVLGDLCGAGEKAARDGNPGGIDLAAVIDTYSRSRREFLAGDQKNRCAA